MAKSGRRIEMAERIPIEIDPEAVYFIVVKAREYDEKDELGEPDPDEDPAEEAISRGMRYYNDDPVAQEIKDAIDGLNDDHQAELVALMWLGRGDYTPADWTEATRTARERHTGPTAEYLLGEPMLGDYLEEGLVQLGYTMEDMEPSHG
jgi:hypothetical protein